MSRSDDHNQELTTLEIVDRIQSVAKRIASPAVRRSLLRAGCDLTESVLLNKLACGRLSTQRGAMDR